MKKSTWIIILIVIVVGAGIAFAMSNKDKDSDNSTNSSSSSSSSDDTTPPSDSNSAATDQVMIQNFAFAPQSISVKVGTKVTWTNMDSVAHTVTADTPSPDAPDSGSIAQNATYSFTFTKAGTYTYHCTPHPQMTGTVVVTE